MSLCCRRTLLLLARVSVSPLPGSRLKNARRCAATYSQISMTDALWTHTTHGAEQIAVEGPGVDCIIDRGPDQLRALVDGVILQQVHGSVGVVVEADHCGALDEGVGEAGTCLWSQAKHCQCCASHPHSPAYGLFDVIQNEHQTTTMM